VVLRSQLTTGGPSNAGGLEVALRQVMVEPPAPARGEDLIAEARQISG